MKRLIIYLIYISTLFNALIVIAEINGKVTEEKTKTESVKTAGLRDKLNYWQV